MATDLDTYCQQFLYALRMRDVPAARIGEAVAEVESHVADTGEDPVVAFGAPAEYAERLADSLGRPHSRFAGRSAYIPAILVFTASAVATASLRSGSPWPAVAALAVLAGVGGWFFLRRAEHRIVDPRTGAALRISIPRWAIIVVAVSLAVVAVNAVLP
jgi:hypothetical protein